MDGGAHSVSATRAALHPELALQRYDAHSFHRLSRAREARIRAMSSA